MMRFRLTLLLLLFALAVRAQSDTVLHFPETFPPGFFSKKQVLFPPENTPKADAALLTSEATKAMHETGFDTIGYGFPYLKYKSKKDTTADITLAEISWLLDADGDKTQDLVMSYFYGPMDCGTIIFFKKGSRYTRFTWMGSYLTAIDYNKGIMTHVTDLHWDCCTYGYNTYISEAFIKDDFRNDLTVRIPSSMDSLPPLKLQSVVHATTGALLRPHSWRHKDEPHTIYNGSTPLAPGQPIAIYAERKVNGSTWYVAMMEVKEGKESKFFMGWICEDEISRP